MTELSDDPTMRLMQQSLIDQKEGKVETKVVETPVEKVETPIVKVETPVEKVETPIVKVETPVEKVETPAAKVETPEAKVKSFDEELFEKTGGKFKSVAEIETLMNAPKTEFANEKIAHLNELAAKGIDVTSREFLDLQSKDFAKMENADEILYEKWMIQEGKGLSAKTIMHEINKKYNVDEWRDKAPEDLTADDIANQEKMLRDKDDAKAFLINYKNERVLEKAVDPTVLKALADKQEQDQNTWEKFVDSDLVNKITKFNVPVNDKGDSFEYEVSEQDSKEVGEIMKALTKDPMVFFGQFLEKDDSGKVSQNHAALVKMMLKGKNFDKAVSLSYAEGVAKEALRAEKEAKNTNFAVVETGVANPTFATPQEALADAFGKQKM
ncbi:MAG: hypothetical protein V4721_10195 [Bacteroidota bacterium]